MKLYRPDDLAAFTESPDEDEKLVRRGLCERLEGATTILNLLSQKFSFTEIGPDIPTCEQEWRLLAVLTAVANLMVRNQEVVAVAVKGAAARQFLVACGVKVSEEAYHEEMVRESNHPTVHVIENPSVGSTRPEIPPIGYLGRFETKHLTSFSPVQLFRLYKSCSFEKHVSIIGHLIDLTIQSSGPAWKNLAIFSILSSAGKLRRRLRSVYFRAFIATVDGIYLPKRVVQLSTDERDALLALAKYVNGEHDAYPNLIAQLNNCSLTDKGLTEAYNLLIDIVQDLSKVHIAMEKVIRKKSASDADLSLAATRVMRVLLLLNAIVFSNIVRFLFLTQAMGLEDALNIERAQKITLPAAENVGGDLKSEDYEDGEDDENDESYGGGIEEDIDDDVELQLIRSSSSASSGDKSHFMSTSPAIQFMTWFRLLNTSVRTSMSLKGVSPLKNPHKIAFDVVVCDQPKPTVDGRKVVKNLVPSRANQLCKSLRKEFDILKDDILVFSGRPHCEAALGLLWAAAKERSEILPGQESGLFARAATPLNIFGISKLCCPVCWLILGYLSDENPIITAGYHTKFFPCTFPPHLPIPVMRDVVAVIEGQLKTALIRFKPNIKKPPSSPQSDGLPGIHQDIAESIREANALENEFSK